MTLPIRISVRVDFDDGSQHEYEVRGPDAVPAPGGFWPEGVVTADVAQRIEHDRKQTAEIVAQTAEIVSLRDDLDCLLAVATLYLGAFGQDEMVTLPEKLRLQEVEEILERRGRRY